MAGRIGFEVCGPEAACHGGTVEMRSKRGCVGKSAAAVVAVLALGGVLVCGPGAFAADPYLDALESEASGLAVDPASRPETRTHRRVKAPNGSNWSVEHQGLGEALPGSLTREAFEEALKRNFYGTYVFYRKLHEPNRQAVYRFYQEHPSVEEIRSTIIGLLARQ
jgi:hypothetical protein